VNPNLVVVPTYNERESIAEVLSRAMAASDDIDVLVVDDSSPDGTGRFVGELERTNARIHLLQRGEKRGLGSAYIEAFQWALERGYDAVAEMDADLSHDPAALPELFAALGHADLAIGSRYVAGGRVENWSPLRRALSRSGNAYARWWLGIRIRDATSGFRAYRATLLRNEHIGDIHSEGYAFQIELAYRATLLGATVTEVPITFTERASGRSKLSRRIVLEALWRVPIWAIRHRLLRR
jgi:dolichol-phosphate mannosyltransferase